VSKRQTLPSSFFPVGLIGEVVGAGACGLPSGDVAFGLMGDVLEAVSLSALRIVAMHLANSSPALRVPSLFIFHDGSSPSGKLITKRSASRNFSMKSAV